MAPTCICFFFTFVYIVLFIFQTNVVTDETFTDNT